jgi:hypothetical protein
LYGGSGGSYRQARRGVDAIDAGGGGDPYTTLDEEERAALSEACLLASRCAAL